MTTIDGVVAVDGGGAWVRGRWFPLPLARKALASAVGLKADEPFPVRWRLKVPMEGESEPRAGEFPEVETPEDEAADSDFP